MTEIERCDCGSGLAYGECCEPLITGARTAETAEALMRSRYTAYSRKETGHILKSTHPDQIQPDTEKTIESWAKKTQWHSFEIVATDQGGADDEEGTVEFIAHYTEKDKRRQHHELAVFQKKDGAWYFYDAKMPQIKQVVRQSPKIGRNDPCPCGSGKKYKKCCGR